MTYDLNRFLSRDDSTRTWCTSATGVRTYSDLRDDVLAVAEHLRTLGEPNGRHVVVACEHARHFVPALFGAWQAGFTVELPPNFQAQTHRQLANEPRIMTVLHDAQSERGVFVPDVSQSGVKPASELRALSGDEVLLLLHTSGTTSTPKRISKTAEQMFTEIDALAQTFAWPDATFLSTVPSHHLFGFCFGILLPLRLGGAIADAHVLLPEDVAAALRNYNSRALITTPSHLRNLDSPAMPRGLEIVSSGARLPGHLQLDLSNRHSWTIHDIFGSTETGAIATRVSPIANWEPLVGVRVDADSLGQLHVDSPWARDTACADRIKLKRDGSFSILGRADSVVKVAGKRVDLVALEDALLRAPGVQDAAVVAREDEVRGTRLFAFVATGNPPPDSAANEKEIRALLLAEFDATLVPRRILRLPALPREATGKLRREKLIALLESEKSDAATRLSLEPCDAPHTFRVTAHRDCIYFRGHFPDVSVLPGVAQLSNIVAVAARRSWSDLGPVERLSRARFRRTVFPGQTLTVSLVRAAASVRYEIRVDADALVADGTLYFGIRA